MRFNNSENYLEELTFDDVFLYQQLSSIESRTQIDIKPKSPLSTTLPIISSNMNAVTGKRMAEKLARLGGIGVLPQDMEVDRMLNIINYVHSSDLRLDTPLTVNENNNIRDAIGIINKRSSQTVIMVDANNEPISIFKEQDLIDKDEYTKLKDLVKSRKLIVGNENISDEEAFNIMEDNGISSLPIVNHIGQLVGVLSKNDSVRNEIYSPSLNKNGQLDIAVALSVNGYKNYIDEIIKSGVNTIFLDTAHGYTSKMLDAIKDVRDRYNDIIIVAGNIMSGEGARDLIQAGSNGVKVGIGPGAMCTTRMMTGVGRPQFTAVNESSVAARENGGFAIADGGIRHPRDLALSLAAGATHVMLGTLLSGTYESPGDIKTDSDGKLYKENYGMASGKAVSGRTNKLTKFEQAKRERYKEGISKSKIYNVKPLGDIVDKFRTGLESSISYSGATDIEQFHDKAIIGVQTQAGFAEGTPHGKEKR
ncbi:MAG: GuaB1 family IMP dehydrogenase-related protein [Candidatus Gracilibacteria bacterium]|nr:GuaB1 family IMP dehydrogenase-related protein [Candidatus Gracilibacteria bacterium]